MAATAPGSIRLQFGETTRSERDIPQPPDEEEQEQVVAPDRAIDRAADDASEKRELHQLVSIELDPVGYTGATDLDRTRFQWRPLPA